MPITATGRWASAVLEERGRRIVGSLDESGSAVFGTSTSSTGGVVTATVTIGGVSSLVVSATNMIEGTVSSGAITNVSVLATIVGSNNVMIGGTNSVAVSATVISSTSTIISGTSTVSVIKGISIIKGTASCGAISTVATSGIIVPADFVPVNIASPSNVTAIGSSILKSSVSINGSSVVNFIGSSLDGGNFTDVQDTVVDGGSFDTTQFDAVYDGGAFADATVSISIGGHSTLIASGSVVSSGATVSISIGGHSTLTASGSVVSSGTIDGGSFDDTQYDTVVDGGSPDDTVYDSVIDGGSLDSISIIALASLSANGGLVSSGSVSIEIDPLPSTVTLTGTLMKKGTMTSAGVGSVALTGTLFKNGTMTSAGVGSVALTETLIKYGTMTSAGVGSVAVSGTNESVIKTVLSDPIVINASSSFLSFGAIDGQVTALIFGYSSVMASGNVISSSAVFASNSTSSLMVSTIRMELGNISSVGTGGVAANGQIKAVSDIISVTATSAVTPSGILMIKGTSSTYGTGLVTVNGNVIAATGLSISATSSLSSSAKFIASGTVSTTGKGNLTAEEGMISLSGPLLIHASSSLSASTYIVAKGSIACSGKGTVSVIAHRVAITPSLTVIAKSNVRTTETLITPASTSVSSNSTVTAIGRVIKSGAVGVNAQGMSANEVTGSVILGGIVNLTDTSRVNSIPIVVRLSGSSFRSNGYLTLSFTGIKLAQATFASESSISANNIRILNDGSTVNGTAAVDVEVIRRTLNTVLFGEQSGVTARGNTTSSGKTSLESRSTLRANSGVATMVDVVISAKGDVNLFIGYSIIGEVNLQGEVIGDIPLSGILKA